MTKICFHHLSIPPPATDVEIPASSVYLGEFRSAWQWDVWRVKSFDPARTCDKHDSSLRRLYHSRFLLFYASLVLIALGDIPDLKHAHCEWY